MFYVWFDEYPIIRLAVFIYFPILHLKSTIVGYLNINSHLYV